MKLNLLALNLALLLIPALAGADIAFQTTEPAIIEKGPHHRTYQFLRVRDVGGKPFTNVQSYVGSRGALNVWEPWGGAVGSRI
jgi:hypothetical protein